MPKHKSAAKCIRQEARRQERNVARKSQLKTAVKKVEKGLEAKNLELATAALIEAIPVIDRASSKGIIHKNNAARKKSRLMHQLAVLKAGA